MKKKKITGLIGYPLIHPVNPVTQPDQSESGHFADGSPDIRIDRIQCLPLVVAARLNLGRNSNYLSAG
jgi:hypothetical protein